MASENDETQSSLFDHLEAIVDMKFTYVVTCQMYGKHKRTNDPRAADILKLMVDNPSLRVAYIDENDEGFYSVLVKAVDQREQEIYSIKLPGPAKIGEGKPENQNHAIIFTRGEALQTIDMNQDNYLEETFKMRNLLEEFNKDKGVHSPTILGVREHVFTGSVSSVAWLMANQERMFVTIGLRVLTNPLKVRFHYGHPDVFDILFHITRGGISKASRAINLSEDIFAGFNSVLRCGNITHHEYIQVGKGRDVGLNQVSLFEAKIACGNGEQTLSRDIYRLGQHFDFFRMLSCYYTSTGFYISSMILSLTIYAYLYGRMYLALSGIETSIVRFSRSIGNQSLETVLASVHVVQFGFVMLVPMGIEILLEKGFRASVGANATMLLLLAPVFFTFSLGTKLHYFGRTILHGGAKYRATGRGFVLRHEKFAENYRMYSRSHFIKGIELMVLLIVYLIYGAPLRGFVAFMLFSLSMWLLIISWLYAPFLFNPSGFERIHVLEDWNDWIKWIDHPGGIVFAANKSWVSWWDEELGHLHYTGFYGRLCEVALSLRFFVYQYGIVYHLDVANGNKSIMVYWVSWIVFFGTMAILKVVTKSRDQMRADSQLKFRLFKLLLLFSYAVFISLMFAFLSLSVGDIFASILAFLLTGWGLVQIAQACRPFLEGLGTWGSVMDVARFYDFLMGTLLFLPIFILSLSPSFSEFQTWLLFPPAVGRSLHRRRFLAGQ